MAYQLRDRDSYGEQRRWLTHEPRAWGDFGLAAAMQATKSVTSKVYYAVDDPANVAVVRFVPAVAETAQVFALFVVRGTVVLTLCRQPAGTWRARKDVGTRGRPASQLPTLPEMPKPGTDPPIPRMIAATTVEATMESAEHAAIPETLTLRFPDGDLSAGTSTTLVLPGKRDSFPVPPVSLTYGQVLALGGDFYGRRAPDYVPISDAPAGDPYNAAAREAFGQLDYGDRAELQKILAIMAVEQKGLTNAHPPSGASAMYAALADELSMEWNQATGGGRLRLPRPDFRIATALQLPALAALVIFWQIDLPMPQGRYLLLATKNFDHFGADAVTAYRHMHAYAIRVADNAGRTQSEPKLARHLLEQAYLINAFADHFLTDIFSSGHLRTPRRRLYDVVGATGPGGVSLPAVPNFPLGTWMSGMLSRFMHDEDCHQGLLVHNKRGDTWTAYGDKRLFDDVAKDNLRLVREAVQTSIDEVYNAFVRKDPTPPAPPPRCS